MSQATGGREPPKGSDTVATLFHKSRSLQDQQLPPTKDSDKPHISKECVSAFEHTLRSLFPQCTIKTRCMDSGDDPCVMEITISAPSDFKMPLDNLRRDIHISTFEREWNVEAVFQQYSQYSSKKRLAVFDMDSTLIQQEVIDEVARKLGVEREVSTITARAMNGELDFTASLRARCALLRGVPSSVFEELKSVITYTPGAEDLVRALKSTGCKTAVLSGGFTPLASWVAGRLGLDYAHANHLVVSEDGKTLTGELEGEIVNAEKKREHVLSIAKKEGIELEHVLAVGDGANDLKMMSVAGLGVAFNAKPKVQQEAPARLNSSSLLDVLYLLGHTKKEQEELLR